MDHVQKEPFKFLNQPRAVASDQSESGKDRNSQTTQNTEAHCLEDACIYVRVRKGSLNHGEMPPKRVASSALSEDMSLKNYAEKTSEGKIKISVDTTEYEHYHFMDNDIDEDEENGTLEQSESLMALTQECKQYLDPLSYAEDLVNNIVNFSEDKVELYLPTTSQEAVEEENEEIKDEYAPEYRQSTEYAYIEMKKSPILWPTIESFAVEGGAYTIDEYIASFDNDEDWMYVIYFQGQYEDEASVLYNYQAVFSLPTWRYPVAQATANVYFRIEVSKLKPKYCFVDVLFKYETFRQWHKPGHSDFNEKWLHYVLDSKIKFFQTVTY